MWQEIQFQALHFRLSRKNPGKQSYLAIQKNGENLYCTSAAVAAEARDEGAFLTSSMKNCL